MALKKKSSLFECKLTFWSGDDEVDGLIHDHDASTSTSYLSGQCVALHRVLKHLRTHANHHQETPTFFKRKIKRSGSSRKSRDYIVYSQPDKQIQLQAITFDQQNWIATGGFNQSLTQVGIPLSHQKKVKTLKTG